MGRVPPVSDSVQLGTDEDPVSERGGVIANEDMESLDDGGFQAGSSGGVTHTREHTALTSGVVDLTRRVASPSDDFGRMSQPPGGRDKKVPGKKDIIHEVN